MKKKLFAGAALLGALALGLGIGVTSTAAEPAGAYYADDETDTFRIYFNRGVSYANYGDEWKISDGTSTYVAAGYLSIYTDGSVYLPYFDLPLSLVGKELTVTAYYNGNVTDATFNFTYNDGDNASVYYIYQDDNQNYTYSQGTANEDPSAKLDTDAIQTVLAAYYTCSDDKNNGYGNFGKVFETWICENYGTDYENWLINGMLGDYPISDYATGASYANDSKTETTDLWTKAITMLELYNENVANDASSESIVTAVTGNSGVALAALGALAAVAVVGVGTYLIISRRKKA